MYHVPEPRVNGIRTELAGPGSLTSRRVAQTADYGARHADRRLLAFR